MLIPRNVFPIVKAADKNSNRYALSGVRLERDASGQPCAVATDGKRLIVCEWSEDNTEWPESIGDNTKVNGFGTIVPVDAWNEASKLAPKKTPKAILKNVLCEEPSANGTVTLAASDWETTRTIKPRTLEGRFPRWRDVIPEYKTGEYLSMVVDAKQVAETLETVLAMSTADSKLTVQIPFADGKPFVVLGSDPSTGSTTKAVVMPHEGSEIYKTPLHRGKDEGVLNCNPALALERLLPLLSDSQVKAVADSMR